MKTEWESRLKAYSNDYMLKINFGYYDKRQRLNKKHTHLIIIKMKVF